VPERAAAPVTGASRDDGREKNVGFKLRATESCLEVDRESSEKANSELADRSGVLGTLKAALGFKKNVPAPRVTFDEIAKLQEIYLPEIEFVERLLGQDLTAWKTCSPSELLKL
jgi:hypothetical protein